MVIDFSYRQEDILFFSLIILFLMSSANCYPKEGRKRMISVALFCGSKYVWTYNVKGARQLWLLFWKQNSTGDLRLFMYELLINQNNIINSSVLVWHDISFWKPSLISWIILMKSFFWRLIGVMHDFHWCRIKLHGSDVCAAMHWLYIPVG